MTERQRPQILLTNDDGIRSPGLWAAAEALSALGFVTVAAPRDQSSSTGRAMPNTSDGILREEEVRVNGQTWKVFAVGGTPAQAVQHGVLELLERPPDLVVAGINYGENVSTSITISGTVGAAMEGAAQGARALAVSLETDREHHLSHSEEVDFSVAAYFTARFAEMLLTSDPVFDMDLLKVDVPSNATRDTPWKLTRLTRARYYRTTMPKRENFELPGATSYELETDLSQFEPGSDAYVLRVERMVSVTPLSLDLTSRLDLAQVEAAMKRSMEPELAEKGER